VAYLDVSGMVSRMAYTMSRQPIRVLRIIARMNVGGPAWQVSVLTRGLNNSEFSSLLVCGEISEGEADFLALRDPDLEVTRVTSLGRGLSALDDIRAFLEIVRLIREFKPDVVHTHTAKAGTLGRIAAVLMRVPVRVHTFHGHVLHGYFSPLVTRIFVLIERVLALFTHGIVSVGSQVRDDLLAVKIGTFDKYQVIAPGVAKAEVIDQVLARDSLGVAHDAQVLLFVGRLTEIKRPDRLLGAFSLVLKKVPSAVLLFAGEGELFEKTKADASHFGESVRFLGWRSDLALLFAATDVAVLSSDNEGMPVTLIEASMAGVPCVTTDVGSAREVVLDGKTGFVVETESEALANAVLKILKDRELQDKMGKAAVIHTEKNFGTGRLVQDHIDLYEALVNR
jgi:glycosyltransferase involved in cell wall biosynthesis